MFEEYTPYDDCEPAGLELPLISLDEQTLSSLSLDENASSLDILRQLARHGIIEKGIDKFPNKKQYYDRVLLEIQVFDELGFIDYVLLNWEIVGYAKKNKFCVGDGRGSGASSLVLYLLNVTNIDPIEHNLYFERFVSKSRAKKVTDKRGKEFLVGSLAPDVDTDISHVCRPKLIEYIEEKYKGRTSKILTFNTFSAKLCIKEVVKYFGGYSEDEASIVSDMVPKQHGVVLSLKKSIEENEKFAEWVSENKDLYLHALVLENLNKNVGVHPSGIAICAEPVEKVIPLQLTKEGSLVSAYDMGDVSDLMVKFDILGLKTLTTADRVCKRININLEDIDANDPFIYCNLQDFKYPSGLFQISAPTNFRVINKVKPLNLNELSDSIAIGRPAALQFLEEYVCQKNFLEKLGIDETLDKILASTKNVMLFQEQTMKVCHEVFGMTLDDAEQLRRCIGKKKVKEIPQWKDKIFNAAKERGLDVRVAEYFWSVVEVSADYQFNASHSLAYASLAAKTVWLKYKYPQEFFRSILETSADEPDPLEVVGEVTRELLDFNIKLLPPRLDKSKMGFEVEGENIRYGFQSVKGISEKTRESLEALSKLKPENKYDVFLYSSQVGLNIGALTSLIYAGALGEQDRLRIALEAQSFNKLTNREQRNFYKIGERYQWKLLESIIDVVNNKVIGDDNKPIMSQSRFETFKKKFATYKELYQQNKTKNDLAIWWFEKKILGYSYSSTLKSCFDYVGNLNNILDLDKLQRWRIVGHVDDVFVKLSANGNKYMNLVASDEKSQKSFLFCDSRNNTKLSDWLDTHEVNKEDVVIVSGTTSRDKTFFIENLEVIDAKIYIKTRELK